MAPADASEPGVRAAALAVMVLAGVTAACTLSSAHERAPAPEAREVGVVTAASKDLSRSLIVSSELVPFQQIDVYAKEAGFVDQLYVDYGTRVKAGQTMAVLTIPELQMQIYEDDAAVKAANSQVARMQKEVNRIQAEYNVLHLEFTRLDRVSKTQPGLVAQQEVDDSQGKDLAAAAQQQAAEASLEASRSDLVRAGAKRRQDQALFDYSKITAPFDGVVTQRYANLGTLMQAGTNSSMQALPLVQLSEDDLFRLVIPVPESFVPYMRVGAPVDVRVPSLGRAFPGRVARFSVDVSEDTRTMHTEVDVPNTNRLLTPGLYAEATLTLDAKKDVLTAPQEAVNINGDERSVWVVSPSGTVERRKVTTGIETPDDIEIVSGLRAGELLAVGDRSSLKAGEKVRPKQVQLMKTQEQRD